MNPLLLKAELLNFAVDRCGHESSRNYLGMSAIGKCTFLCYRMMTNGEDNSPSFVEKVKFHESRLGESELLKRLRTLGYLAESAKLDIYADFDMRFAGHLDGRLVDGDILDIKTVPDDVALKSIQDSMDIPRVHFFQMQAYMRHGDASAATLIYKSRASGMLFVYRLMRRDSVGEKIDQKAKIILAAVDGGQIPACDCGYCENAPDYTNGRRIIRRK